MSPRAPYQFTEAERASYAAALAFLKNRMTEQETINWALGLRSDQEIERRAVLSLVEHPPKKMPKLWSEAWRLVEEAWDEDKEDNLNLASIKIERRIKDGELSGTLIDAIVRNVRARLDISARPQVKNPKDLSQLLAISFTSAKPIDPAKLGLSKVDDPQFLANLASALGAVLDRTLEAAHRLGWTRSIRWRVGDVRRVYWDKKRPTDSEPDEFAKGIAGNVKVLYGVLDRLAEIDCSRAQLLISGWEQRPETIYRRLWAALARRKTLTPPEIVARFLMSLSDEDFWDLNSLPEYAELRSMRFSEFPKDCQAVLLTRIKKGPPKRMWKNASSSVDLDSAQTYWSLREFKRLEAGQYVLPSKYSAWVEQNIGDHPELIDANSIDEGFLGGVEVSFRTPNPDNIYDGMSGVTRLVALEKGLGSKRETWDNDPAERARDWLNNRLHTLAVINDLWLSQQPRKYPLLLDRLGWIYGSTLIDQNSTKAEQFEEFQRFAIIIRSVPPDTALQAIEGLSNWADSWKEIGAEEPTELTALFDFLWPFALRATNANKTDGESFDLNAVARTDDDEEPMDLDTLNTPVGRLVGVFIQLWSKNPRGRKPFSPNSSLRRLRDTLFGSTGRSAQIVRHRFIELINYFLGADPVWTKANLVPLLRSKASSSTALWRAFVRRQSSREVIRILGGDMLFRATDPRLGRASRQRLVFDIVLELLHATLRKNKPLIGADRIQQLLRNVEDEIRSHAANILMMFLRDNVKGEFSRERLFTDAVAPFLETVWPQERELVTPAVSKSLADMPAQAGKKFSEGVDAIERFLVPFECWSLLDYGLFGEDEGGVKLKSVIVSKRGAQSLLKLLDLTIGHTMSSVVPYDLGMALTRIKELYAGADTDPAYKRLSALTRRL